MKKLLILALSILLLIGCLTSCVLYNVFNPPRLLSKEEPWLKEITSENVVQIQTVHTGEGIPEMIQKISTVKDKNTIDEIIEKYQKLDYLNIVACPIEDYSPLLTMQSRLNCLEIDERALKKIGEDKIRERHIGIDIKIHKNSPFWRILI
jgi:hypothetical protein